MFGIIGDVSDYTPKGILTNIGTKVVERVAPGTLAAVGGNIEEVKTRVGVTVDVVVTNDNGATVRRDFDTKPDSENKFEVAGGKGVSSVAAGVLLGSIGRKLPGKGDGADAPDVTPPAGRPSSRQAEIDAVNKAGPGFVEQQSFKGGEPARFGEPGSVRPDAFNCKTCISLEVKAFDLSRLGGISSLTSNIAKQAKERVDNLPKGATQEIKIDARGQTVSRAAEARIKADIVRKSGDIIKTENIEIRRK